MKVQIDSERLRTLLLMAGRAAKALWIKDPRIVVVER